jgi:hypothetical protein
VDEFFLNRQAAGGEETEAPAPGPEFESCEVLSV